MRPSNLNPAKFASLFRKEFELCKVAAGETVVVLSDLSSRRSYVEAAFAAAFDLGANIYEMCVNQVPSWTKVGVPTVGACKGTVEAIEAADLLVCLHGAFFTGWVQRIREAGTRVVLAVDHPDDLEQLMAPPGLKEAVLHADQRLADTKMMRVVSEAGTDLSVACGEYPVMSQYGYADEPGRMDQWGVGHVHTFPNEGSANGRVVIAPGDIIILPYCRYVVDEISLEVRDGFIRDIDGGLDAKLMRTWLEEHKTDAEDLDPFAISHLGWGLNPQARWDGIALYGDDPERSYAATRAFPGNFLFSTGPNNQGGGTRTTRGHYDVPMRDCTVMLDNDVIVDAGRIVDERMVVQAQSR